MTIASIRKIDLKIFSWGQKCQEWANLTKLQEKMQWKKYCERKNMEIFQLGMFWLYSATNHWNLHWSWKWHCGLKTKVFGAWNKGIESADSSLLVYKSHRGTTEEEIRIALVSTFDLPLFTTKTSWFEYYFQQLSFLIFRNVLD